MRENDHGVAPNGGILMAGVAGAASGEAVGPQPTASREAAPGIPTEEGSAIVTPPRARGEPETGAAGGGREKFPAAPVSDPGQPEPAVAPIEPASTSAPRSPLGSDREKHAAERGPVAVRSSGVVARPVVDTSEPSLARVLATTIRLWVSRRLRKIGIGPRRPLYAGAGASQRKPAEPARSRSAWRWRLAAIVLAVAILALVAIQLSGVLSKPGSASGTAAGAGTSGASSLSAAAAARNQAAAWVAQQVGSNNVIACDPVVCSALLGRGIPAGRLLPLQSAGANPFGADVIVASPAVRSEYGSELTSVYAPGLIASFGTGAARVDVRAVAAGGGAAYRAADQPDLNARKAAGAQLLRNPRFRATAQAARQITAGQVDARLLVTLASLVSQRAVSVVSFGGTGPGAPVQFRQVTITSPGGQGSALTADLDQVRTQRTPYLPENATIVHPGGPTVLRIEFGAPSLQGLLTGGNSSLLTAPWR
jgi:hypothetical protein